ncbi:MAG: hypothetical protein ACR2PK_08410 [Acidimicrobiales bacterium]
MRLWKVLGIAGIVGIAAGGAVVARRRQRQWHEYDADEIRARLHERFAESGSN